MSVVPARAAGLAMGAALLVLLSGCDPCSGVLSCSPGPYLAVDGRMVDSSHGLPLPGVSIQIVRTAGIAIARDSASSVTGADGTWHIDLDPLDAGTLYADIEVSPPGSPSYRLSDVPLVTSDHRGDGRLNQRWVPFVSIDAFGEFYFGGSQDVRAAGATVQFHRTGGVPWAGPGVKDDTWSGVTDPSGHVPLFPRAGPRAVIFDQGGLLRGDLVITTADGAGVMTVRNVVLGSSNMYHDHSFLPPILRLPVRASGRDSLTLGGP